MWTGWDVCKVGVSQYCPITCVTSHVIEVLTCRAQHMLQQRPAVKVEPDDEGSWLLQAALTQLDGQKVGRQGFATEAEAAEAAGRVAAAQLQVASLSSKVSSKPPARQLLHRAQGASARGSIRET